jgi:UDP-glucose 4-epimerase
MPLVARSRAVIHLASRSTPGSSAGQALAELNDNLRPTLALLQALQHKPGIELLYLSSGGSLYGPAFGPSAETAKLDPRSYHGAAKVAAEHFILAWCAQYSGTAIVLRPSNIYGPGQTERAGFGIIPAGFGKIARNEVLTVWGDGSTIRDYLYIDDFIALCMATVASPMPMGVRVLNASTGVGVSLTELFAEMETVAGKPLRRVHEINRKVDAPKIVMNPFLASVHYHWTPTTSLHEGLTRTWNWFSTTRR